jgi:hypothetical protein
MSYTPEMIRERLESDDRWVQRALVALYKKQTADEQSTESTRHTNGVGFAQNDAAFLSSLAKQVLAGRTLSAKQIHFARFSRTGRPRIMKYARQLAEIANERASA